MPEWQDVDDDSPFAGVQKVDGLVYDQDDTAVELRVSAQQLPTVPLPPHRPAPQRPQPRNVEAWEPIKVDPATFLKKPKRANPIKPLLFGVLPLGLVGAVLWFVLGLYGFR